MWKLLSLVLIGVVSGDPVKAMYRNFYGVGTTDLIDLTKMRCLLEKHYEFVFLQLFKDGQGDEIGLKNLALTENSSLYTELYVIPDPSKPAAKQLNDIVAFGKKNNYEFNFLWFQITDPLRWNSLKEKNVIFINQFAAAAKAQGIELGYFTNWYDYKQITDNSQKIQSRDIFYWNTLGSGPSAETANNVNDFRPFGPFKGDPFAKQYGIDEEECGLKVTKNVHYGDAVPLLSRPNLEYFVYVTPDTKSSADQQAEDLLNFGYKHCAEFLLLFLEITDPLRWKTNKQKNVDFINEFVDASESRAMRVGFYTSWYDYKVITNNSNQTTNDILFYWNTLGAGPNAETASNINDFRPFGPFKDLPALKQYGKGQQNRLRQ
ncbi:unnamed protein product [Bursaphelenchus xylophilus]|uniref:(pine wood nematode) hypothetical protein n=1 Tax=Bursaphelenchus xylophilus TaxID=6326 RepID=A0A1I7SB18_BURXY|nr:unnamed protein product [Bursaphelenchus xylophilus]CAG9105891.1 unnamed protein product [Bursaphelenchus xylophilus]